MNALHLLEEISIDENRSLSQEARDKLLNVIDMAPADTVSHFPFEMAKKHGNYFLVFQENCCNLLLLNLSGTKDLVSKNVTGFVHPS